MATQQKYRNEVTEHRGIKYQSKLEMRRHLDLLLLEKAGEIHGLQRQVPYVLAPAVKFHDEMRTTPNLRYVADFVYVDKRSGRTVIEDAKSDVTRLDKAFRIKRHLMKTVLGLDIFIYNPKARNWPVAR